MQKNNKFIFFLQGSDTKMTAIVQKFRPVDLFANTFPRTIPALRCARKSWKQLDRIIFAFAHLKQASVPARTALNCVFVWNCFRSTDCNIAHYMETWIDKLCHGMSHTLKTVLFEALRFFFLSCTTMRNNVPMQSNEVRVTEDAALVGVKCKIMGCVCMLFGNSTHDIHTTPVSEFNALWLTRSKLRVPRRSNRRLRQPKTQSF